MTDAERLIVVKNKTGLQWKELAAQLQLTSAQRFTDIRSGRYGISHDLAKRIHERFPAFSIQWLISGTEELKEGLPVINPNVISDGSPKPLVNLQDCFPGAEGVVRMCDDGMVEYPVGAILVIKEVKDVSLLVPGRNYLICTDEFFTARRVQQGSNANSIALYASNPATYPDGRLVYEAFEISKDALRKVYSIQGYIVSEVANIN